MHLAGTREDQADYASAEQLSQRAAEIMEKVCPEIPAIMEQSAVVLAGSAAIAALSEDEADLERLQV